MLVYRITLTKYAGDISGLSAGRFGGRWNSVNPTTKLLYTSTSRALAVLERLVHQNPGLPQPDFSLSTIEIPDHLSIKKIYIKDLPPDWASIVSNPITQRIGDTWLASGESVGLQVPSAVISDAYNILLNVDHPQYSEIRLLSISPFSFDPRNSNAPSPGGVAIPDRTGPLSEPEQEAVDENVSKQEVKEEQIVDDQLSIETELPALTDTALQTDTKPEKENGRSRQQLNKTYNSHIFLSYESENKPIALAIKETLQQYDFKVWMDDDQIFLGQDIAERINFALRKTNFMLALLTRKYLKKPWTKREFYAGVAKEVRKKKKYVLPVLIGSKKDQDKILDEIPISGGSAFTVWENDADKVVKTILLLMAGKNGKR